ncbi:MAG: hypothetical protein HYX68_07115 [Planctomycetes bacterium]|nr:hypothetical protein [Planctomycetota bacterium]
METTEQKMLLNIRQANTDDLLDRITAFRAGLEAEAIDMIETELRRRSVTANQIADHQAKCERDCVFYPDGTAKMCSQCRKPAVCETWAWHRLLWIIPLFPRWTCFCEIHRPTVPAAAK